MPTLDWIGKKAVVNHHREVPYHLLKCDKELSVGDPGSGNLLVQGDNLLALKALLPYYAGRVKCIYIDPPYNTGNENWVYNDAANSPEIRKWLGKVVGAEAEDLSRHDKWLCMMYPRLMILREFLSEDGAIIVSIDDNENATLHLMMDEIFGAKNFVANVIWQKKYAVANDHKTIAPMHDYLLVYRRSEKWKRRLFPRTEEKDRLYKHKDAQGIFRPDNYTCNKTADERPNLFYPITNPNTGEEIYPKRTRVWAYSKEEHARHIRDNMIYWGKDGKGKVPSIKRYKHLLRHGEGIVPQTLWMHDFAGHTDTAKKEIRDILDDSRVFDFITPKPTLLISRVLQLASDSTSLILDSFAGSGSTAHAVLAQNKADGSTRHFILIEMEESICQTVTAQRIARAIEGYKDIPGLGGGFRFCRLGSTVFDETGNIRAGVTFNELAAHVYFAETGEPIPKRTNGKTPLLGIHNGKAIYLLYNGILGDRSFGGGNVLTNPVLKMLPPHNGPRIIFGEGSRLGTARLKREGIIFKQIPYGIKVT
ncbi:MAG: site-specific DNA-methyltransferase [Pirellulales bacterium]|nr:site-specific DNA-methyltransferase [Pirellulales bacterium]